MKQILYMRDHPALQDDLNTLRQSDSLIAPLDIQDREIYWTTMERGFEGLVRIVQAQQIATAVADKLWTKLKDMNDGRITPDWALGSSDETLKTFGFSKQKSNYIKGLAESIENGTLAPESWLDKNDDSITKEITSQKGFGPWSAQIYLIFCLQRPNILPKADLALDRAAQNLFDQAERPSYDRLQALTVRWNGKLTAATLLLWAKYVRDNTKK